ncbi:hypothetical protein [Actinokineospora spheciospongiae]|uniref:hypothetical protein n=1 Tax=Actinokineospora spheciospongiae TaxID=909613 RepID=UPI000D71C52C|nr:hypothetical protein [Actinokineospora spheciospongiae]PWW63594.1 hypothetical protein DFQ13_104587 [Actinokineospora spheciospongiae]
MTSNHEPEPPTQIYSLPGNLIDVLIYPSEILNNFANNTATLKHVAQFAVALNDTTTCLRWLLDHRDTPKAQELFEAFTLDELKAENP